LPIFIKLGGRFIDSRLSQSRNAEAPIAVIPSGSFTDVTQILLLKAEMPISVTPPGTITSLFLPLYATRTVPLISKSFV